MQLSEQTSSPTRKIGSAAEVLDGLKPLWSNAQSRSSSLSVERFKIPGRMVTPRVQFENQHHVAVVWTGKVKENRRALRSMESPHDTLILPFGLALEECTLSGVGFTDFAVSPSFLRRVARETDLSDRFELLPQWALRDPQIEILAHAAEYEISSGLRAGNLFMESLATALAAHLLARYSSPNAAPREYRGGLSPYQLRLTRDFIEANLGEDFGLDDLAANVRMSPYYFCRLFKQSTRLSPHQFVIRERIQQARQLLEEHRFSMVEIASTLGFSDQSHFARVFRSLVGTTPKQYSSQH
jgi:AraC family transcriptional regulator